MNAVATYHPLSSLVSDGGYTHQLGALTHDEHDGVTFRLRAPQADRVYVLGEFNGWNEFLSPLKKRDEGIWEVSIDQAEMGDEYLFVYYSGADRHEMIDPNATELSEDKTFGIIA